MNTYTNTNTFIDEADEDDASFHSDAPSSTAAGDHSIMHKNDDAVMGTKVHEVEARNALMAGKETRLVGCLRVAVYLVVLLVAVMVSTGVYVFTKHDQEEEFQTQFSAFAAKVTESFYDSVEQKMGAVNTLSTTVTSYALSSGATFPNVTIPDFELRGAHTRINSDAVTIYYSPIVTKETKAGWEEYAAYNRNWVMSSFINEMGLKAAQDAKFGITVAPEPAPADDAGPGRSLQVGTIDITEENSQYVIPPEEDGYHVEMFGLFGTNGEALPVGPGPNYIPMWQMTPVIPMINVLNYDLLSHPAVSESLHALLETSTVIMTEASDLRDPDYIESDETTAGLYAAFLATGQYRHETNVYDGDPTTTLNYPVFDNFGPNRTIAGVLITSMYWRLLFGDILPKTAKGIICVLENTRNQTFTYRIDGPKVTFLGPGDRHDANYDGMAMSEDVTKHIQERMGPSNQGFDAVDLNSDYCSYTVHVYPSSDTESQYVTNEPAVYALLVAAVFAFTSMVFVAYDLLVARRQQMILAKAVQSSAIVSSLFPEQVRSRLFADENDGKTSMNGIGGMESWKAMEGGGKTMDSLLDMERAGNSSDRPIADYYDDCTCLFADLSGFTKWSSSRRPEDVFYLLEQLYQAFDKVALIRKVFKVETIGDCYVAVTGLPNPQPENAVIMVKFARDCFAKMNRLLPELAEKLGPDTADLTFRVGLHSGGVTGGVLRGNNARFQLFGDTMNTASRMESTGVAGRIHISQSTATQLESKGYGRWMTAREDKITAKGKGEMDTYFVSLIGAAKTMHTMSTTDSSEHAIITSSHHDHKMMNDQSTATARSSACTSSITTIVEPPVDDMETLVEC